MSDRTSRNPEIPRLVQEFQIILEHYDRFCATEADQKQYVEVVEYGLFKITQMYGAMGYISCPVGRRECPGGGCAPRGRTCDVMIRFREQFDR